MQHLPKLQSAFQGKGIDNTKDFSLNLKCSFCEYQARSIGGLKTHITRKHTKYDESISSFKCENCDEVFENSKDLKDHLFQHSYRRGGELNYKCDECDFWGPNRLTMNMHFKRLHSETMTCGMCKFEASKLEDLDIHTFTCEMYKCNDCGKKFNISHDIKSHMKENHDDGSLFHYKRNRNNQEIFDENFFLSEQMF